MGPVLISVTDFQADRLRDLPGFVAWPDTRPDPAVWAQARSYLSGDRLGNSSPT